jgi:hypothetical protein
MSDSQQALPPGASPRSGVPPPLEYRFQPGHSGNPSGRPKVNRSVSAAYAELQDTAGRSPLEAVENFKHARGEKLCGADHKAIAMFIAESNPENARLVSAATEVTDRLEGKVTQPSSLTFDVQDAASKLAAELGCTREEILERATRVVTGEGR